LLAELSELERAAAAGVRCLELRDVAADGGLSVQLPEAEHGHQRTALVNLLAPGGV
jgi:hypothetical protein